MTETGWGEFEIQIKIYLADPVERPVTIYHVLKLFQVPQSPRAFQSWKFARVKNELSSTLPEIVLNFTQRSKWLISRLIFSQTGTGPSTDPSALKGGKSVVSEFYDEIIFQDPTQYIQVHSCFTQTSPDQNITSTLQPLLTTTRQLTMGAHKHETDFEVGNRTSKLDEKVSCNVIKQPSINS